MATRRVLVVDDEAEVRSALTDILRAMRYTDALEIEGAADGQGALDSVVRQRPDLILLDLQMPRMSGLTLLKHIREVEALRHGAVAYIPKPFDARHVEMLVTTFFDSIKRREGKPITSSR